MTEPKVGAFGPIVQRPCGPLDYTKCYAKCANSMWCPISIHRAGLEPIVTMSRDSVTMVGNQLVKGGHKEGAE